MARVNKNNISEFQEKLLTWYESNGRHFFPWRAKGLSNYELIIAEVLLQRTKAETISKFYRNFLESFPSWKSIALSDKNEIEEYLRPIGLYRQRASRLQQLAIEMVKRDEKIPKDRKVLESIPYMGQYIVNAIELLIFNRKSYLLDVNMARVLERYFGERKLADIRYDPYLQNLAAQISDHEKAKDINWGILDFAASICKARNPKCDQCFLALKCSYLRNITNLS